MKRAVQIGLATLSWAGGLLVAAGWLLDLPLLALLVLAIVALASLKYVRSTLGYVLIIAAFFALGLLRGQLYFEAARNFAVRDLVGEKVSLTGQVVSEPGWNADGHYEFYVDNLRSESGPVPGVLKVKTLVGAAREGQTVRVEGKVGRALGRAETQVWYATVTVEDRHQPYIVRVKERVSAGLAASLRRDQAGFVNGLLFGTRSAVPPSVEEDLRTTGLTHIVAVSGSNLTIIVAAMAIFIRRRDRLALMGLLAAIWIFVVMTGGSASIVRAAIMLSLVLLIAGQRREVDPRIAFAASGIIMTAWNPGYLYGDIGWQLSVLALGGVLFIGPALMPKDLKRHKLLAEILATSLGAHLATAPLIAIYFGTFSFIAPLANLLILPLVPVIMFGGLLAALFGSLVPPLAHIVMAPFSWLIDFVLSLNHQLASLPMSSVNVELTSAWLVAGFYLFLVGLAAIAIRRGSHLIWEKV